MSCIDLSAFITSLGKVRLLKLDIEGAEVRVLNHLMDTGAIELIELTVVETHENQIPSLIPQTDELRSRIKKSKYASRIRLDWI